jgi:FdhE protein
MIAPGATLEGLRRQRPEWEPWLVVVEETLREAADPGWDAAIPAATDAQRTSVPLLAGATLALEARAVRGLWERLIRIASRTGTPQMSTLKTALSEDLETMPLFTASLCQDHRLITELTAASGADAAALQAIVALLPVPFLHACNRRWASSISPGWLEGYCPVCGSWPAFAEVRGIERNRYYRCGRCGGEWHAHALQCPFCAMSDHHQLAVLVPEHGSSNDVIEACQRCLGYVKALTRLQGCPPLSVMLEDLASVDLDVAAFEHGFARQSVPGYALGNTVTDKRAGRRFFAWKS